MVTHHNLIANVEQLVYNSSLHIESKSQFSERWISFLPRYHAFGQLYTCLMAAKRSHPVFIMQIFVFEEFCRAIETHRITDIPAAPPS